MKIFKKLGILVTTMSLLVGMSACTQQPNKETTKTEGITIIDQAGRKVTLEKPAEKVVSGYYIATSTLLGLGQKDKLVGVEMKADKRPIYKMAAPEIVKLPAMGNKKMFNVEECAKVKPDVVFLPVSLKSYVEKLESLNIKVILLQPETMDSYDEAVDIIAKACGAQKQAKAYFAYRKNLYETYIKDENANKRVYFAGTKALQSAGIDVFQSELLKVAGAENVMKENGKGNWLRINKETLIKANPDIIFIEQKGAKVSDFTKDAAFASVNAVKHKQVYVFPAHLETWDTPNLSSCLGVLWTYAILYPERVSMDIVKQEARCFYQQFYQIDVDVEELGC